MGGPDGVAGPREGPERASAGAGSAAVRPRPARVFQWRGTCAWSPAPPSPVPQRPGPGTTHGNVGQHQRPSDDRAPESVRGQSIAGADSTPRYDRPEGERSKRRRRHLRHRPRHARWHRRKGSGAWRSTPERRSPISLQFWRPRRFRPARGGLAADFFAAIQNDFTSLRDQVETIVNTVEFNGKNPIANGATDLDVLTTVEGSTFGVSAQVIDATTLLLQPASLTTAISVSWARATVDTAFTTVSNALASPGAGAKRVEIQSIITQNLMDIVTQRVGNLVDADLAFEEAELQSIQIKQQLGVHALAIANSSPDSIL